jgi:hypothetical protein
MCSFSSKKFANAALFMTELLGPLCLSKIFHAEVIGSVSFSIADMAPLKEKISPDSGPMEVAM